MSFDRDASPQCKEQGGLFMKTIITIGRQFGSGGKEIGIRVAKEL